MKVDDGAPQLTRSTLMLMARCAYHANFSSGNMRACCISSDAQGCSVPPRHTCRTLQVGCLQRVSATSISSTTAAMLCTDPRLMMSLATICDPKPGGQWDFVQGTRVPCRRTCVAAADGALDMLGVRLRSPLQVILV